MGDRWQRDERVLRWVLTKSQREHGDFDFEYETNPPRPVAELDGMSSTDLQTSLWRLLEHDLIRGEPPADPNCRQCVELRPDALVGRPSWSRLQPTVSGLIALGEFPEIDRVISAEGLRATLDALATWAPEEAKPRLRQAAGLVGRSGDDALRAMIATAATSRPMSPSRTTQSPPDADIVSERRNLQVLRLFARPGTIDAHGAFTLSAARLRELGVDITSAEMLQAIHALANRGYLGGGHGWVEGLPGVWEDDPTEFPFDSIEYRHFFVSGRGLQALGDWPPFTDLTPTTVAALLGKLADETAEQTQADETRAAARDIRALGPTILDVAVSAAVSTPPAPGQ